MTYLLDTNIISLLDVRRSGKEAAPVVDWLERHTKRIYLSVITLMGMETGVVAYERRGASARARELRMLRESVEHATVERILPVTLDIALEAGRMSGRALPFQPGRSDLLIAATAAVHGLTVLTRNLRHFEPTGVACLDPFASLPPDA